MRTHDTSWFRRAGAVLAAAAAAAALLSPAARARATPTGGGPDISSTPAAGPDSLEPSANDYLCDLQYQACTDGCKELIAPGRRECLLECRATWLECRAAN